MLDLTGKTAIITGCSSGIGEETARVLSRQGAAVTIVARRASKLEALAEELRAKGGKVLVVPGDVTAEGFADEVCEKTVEAFGRVDILVNNAGMGDKNKSCVNTTDELWNSIININEHAQYHFCKAALKVMQPQGSGSIINMSSIGGVYGMAGAAYSAAKAGVLGLTMNIAIQFAGTGIRCNAVCPGATATPMLEDHEGMDMFMLERSGRYCDMTVGFCSPTDIANAVLFFAADESKSVNGQYLVVDKGSCI